MAVQIRVQLAHGGGDVLIAMEGRNDENPKETPNQLTEGIFFYRYFFMRSLTQFKLRPLSVRPCLDGDKEFSYVLINLWM